MASIKKQEKSISLQSLLTREFIKDITNIKKLQQAINSNKAIYCGIDPTGPSLHLGHFSQIVALKWFAKLGLNPIILIGNATGKIGDPSGKNEERLVIDEKTIIHNSEAIKEQLKKIIPEATIYNNSAFYKNFNVINFLQEVGKFLNVNYMLAKEQIERRISGPHPSGISFTEFSYMLLQSYDFYQLRCGKNERNELYNCSVQLGGSDQWGNITAGIDFIERKTKNEVTDCCGVTLHLLVNDKTQKKFGKTESGTVWLSKELTSPTEMYSYLFNQDDDSALKLLYAITLLPNETIKDLQAAHKKEPTARVLQKQLVVEVSKLIYDTKANSYAELNTSYNLFSVKDFAAQSVDWFNDLWGKTGKLKASDNDSIMNILDKKKQFSHSQIHTLAKSNGIKLNGITVSTVDLKKTIVNFKNYHNIFYVFAIGKRDRFIVKLINN